MWPVGKNTALKKKPRVGVTGLGNAEGAGRGVQAATLHEAPASLSGRGASCKAAATEPILPEDYQPVEFFGDLRHEVNLGTEFVNFSIR